MGLCDRESLPKGLVSSANGFFSSSTGSEANGLVESEDAKGLRSASKGLFASGVAAKGLLESSSVNERF